MAILFILLQLIFTPFAQLNHNTSSRLAAMAAFCDHGNFEISRYRSWTDDWARTPDGRFFSNKAPGGQLLGVPLYCALTAVEPSGADRIARDWKLRYIANFLLCLLFQILPWTILCHAWDKKLRDWGVGTNARRFAAAALFFGTTPAILMDVWMGHGLVALFSLSALLALIDLRPFLLGFSLGMAILTDYSAAFLLPAAVVCLQPWMRKPGTLARIGAGAVAPALAWIAYHQSAFGGVFAIANRFQNPQFRDKLGDSVQLWGILGLPSPTLLLELLFGWKRGILFSQPWVFVALALPFLVGWRGHLRLRLLYTFAAVSFVLLLGMNASFGGWHGGASTGPRYLSAALPLFAIPLALVWDQLASRVRWIALGGLSFALVVFALGKVIGPTVGLWPEFLAQWRDRAFEISWKMALLLMITAPFAVKLARTRPAQAGLG